MMAKKYKRTFLFLILFFFILFLLPLKTEAAVLSLRSRQNLYFEEDIFMVQVKLETEKELVNAIKGELIFSNQTLEVIDISRGESVLSFWPERPSFCNEQGKISFIGGVPGGFVGQENIISIIFRAKPGLKTKQQPLIQFKQTSLALLNDGLGTPAELKLEPARLTVWPEKRDIPLDEWRESLIKDDRPPEPFEIIIARDRLIFDGQHFIFFKSIDSATGIDYYEIREGDSDWQRGESPYLLQDQTLQSLIQVKAVDKAGNERIEEINLRL